MQQAAAAAGMPQQVCSLLAGRFQGSMTILTRRESLCKPPCSMVPVNSLASYRQSLRRPRRLLDVLGRHLPPNRVWCCPKDRLVRAQAPTRPISRLNKRVAPYPPQDSRFRRASIAYRHRQTCRLGLYKLVRPALGDPTGRPTRRPLLKRRQLPLQLPPWPVAAHVGRW